MKVLLVKDVYKLGRAGDVKKVANGYGRNFLLPQGLAVVATPSALKQAEKIKERATFERNSLNTELGGLAEQISSLVLIFTGKAGETGKLYGSITTQMVADAINQKLGSTLNRHDIEAQPIRTLGEHSAYIRLTVDLIPKVKIIVHREGESIEADEIESVSKSELTTDADNLQKPHEMDQSETVDQIDAQTDAEANTE